MQNLAILQYFPGNVGILQDSPPLMLSAYLIPIGRPDRAPRVSKEMLNLEILQYFLEYCEIARFNRAILQYSSGILQDCAWTQSCNIPREYVL